MPLGRTPRDRDPRDGQRALAREADRISWLILYSDLEEVDIDIAIESLRGRAEEEFPGCEDLFEHLYAARFRRLREDWRDPERRAAM